MNFHNLYAYTHFQIKCFALNFKFQRNTSKFATFWCFSRFSFWATYIFHLWMPWSMSEQSRKIQNSFYMLYYPIFIYTMVGTSRKESLRSWLHLHDSVWNWLQKYPQQKATHTASNGNLNVLWKIRQIGACLSEKYNQNLHPQKKRIFWGYNKCCRSLPYSHSHTGEKYFLYWEKFFNK